MAQLFEREGAPFHGRAVRNEKGQLGYSVFRRPCHRCGGLGGSDKWAHSGWVCFECDGACEVPCDRFVRLYELDELERLNGARDKRRAKIAEQREGRRLAEMARREAERAGVVEAHRDFIERARRWNSPFLDDLINQIEEKARPLSNAQSEAGMKVIERFEEEKARRLAAKHIGVVGERIELELEFRRCLDVGDRWNPFYIWIFRVEGSAVVYKGGWPKAFELVQEPGSKIRVIAEIKEHGFNRKNGEPESIIARPRAVKEAA